VTTKRLGTPDKSATAKEKEKSSWSRKKQVSNLESQRQHKVTSQGAGGIQKEASMIKTLYVRQRSFRVDPTRMRTRGGKGKPVLSRGALLDASRCDRRAATENQRLWIGDERGKDLDRGSDGKAG